MSHSKVNKANGTHATQAAAYECLARYFSGCPEVSSVFVNQGALKPNGDTAVAVLVKDAGMDARTLTRLASRYARGAQACGLGLETVVVLNMSSAMRQYRILREWTLVFERNRSFRTWFYEQAAFSCQAMVVAA